VLDTKGVVVLVVAYDIQGQGEEERGRKKKRASLADTHDDKAQTDQSSRACETVDHRWCNDTDAIFTSF
jgi:hypothetical protein